MPEFIVGPLRAVSAAAVPYQGPGDLGISSPLGFWGLRAFTNAIANSVSPVNIIRLRKSSDSFATIKDLPATSTGTVNLSDPFFDGSTTYRVDRLYEQTGVVGLTMDTNNATTPNPFFVPNGISSSRPSMTFNSATPQVQITTNVTSTTYNYPITTTVFGRNVNTGARLNIVAWGATSISYDDNAGVFANNFIRIADSVGLQVSIPGPSPPAIDGSWSSIISVHSNTTNQANIYRDGASVITGTMGSTQLGSGLTICWGSYVGNAIPFNGSSLEYGVWGPNVTITPTQATQLSQQQHAFWGV